MTHLTQEQVEDYVEGREAELDAHLVGCVDCRRELAAERRLTHALTHLERFSPSPEFSVQLDRALTQTESAGLVQIARTRRPSLRTGIAALLVSFWLLVFAFQTIVAIQDGGTLDFLSLYFSRPDVLSRYPSESLSALIESLPLVELTLTLGLLIIAILLAQQLFGATSGMEPTVKRKH